MGYTVNFKGTFRVEPEFSEEHTKILQKFFENDHRANKYPSPWCDFWISDDRRHIFPLSGLTKEVPKWLKYLKRNYLDKWGYRLSGTVIWRGENTGDAGSLIIDNEGNIHENWLWYYLEDIISPIPHIGVPSPIKPLDWANDEEFREFDIEIKFNKPITKEHEKWLNDFANTIHYARKKVDKVKYGKDGELFLDPVEMDYSTGELGAKCDFMYLSLEELIDETPFGYHLKKCRKVNREKELIRMRTTPAGDCPDLFCQWTAKNGQLSWDEQINFSRPVEWLVFLIKKFFAPNGYVLNGTIRWNGYNDFYDCGTIFLKDNKVAAYALPFPEPTDDDAVNKDGAY